MAVSKAIGQSATRVFGFFFFVFSAFKKTENRNKCYVVCRKQYKEKVMAIAMTIYKGDYTIRREKREKIDKLSKTKNFGRPQNLAKRGFS